MGEPRQTAFLALLEPVHDRLYRYALAVMGDPEEAKDLVGDTILAAYEQFDRVREPDKFLHLLLTIASRKAKRRIFRRRRFLRLDDELIATLSSSHLSIEHATEISILLDLLRHLPEKMRETFVLCEIADLSLSEIQRIQGGSLSGVKSRLVRARERLDQLVTAVNSPVTEGSPRRDVSRLQMATTNLALVERYGK